MDIGRYSDPPMTSFLPIDIDRNRIIFFLCFTLIVIRSITLEDAPFGTVVFEDLIAKGMIFTALLAAAWQTPTSRIKVIWAFFSASFALDFCATAMEIFFQADNYLWHPSIKTLATLITLSSYAMCIFPVCLLNKGVSNNADWRLPSIDALIASIAGVVIIWISVDTYSDDAGAVLSTQSILSTVSYGAVNLALLVAGILAAFNPSTAVPPWLHWGVLLSITLGASADVAYELYNFLGAENTVLARLNYLLWAASIIVLAITALATPDVPYEKQASSDTEKRRPVFLWLSMAAVSGLFILLATQIASKSFDGLAVCAAALGLAGLLLVLRQFLVGNFEKADFEVEISGARTSLNALSLSLNSLIEQAPIAIAARGSDAEIITANANFLVLADACPDLTSLPKDVDSTHQLREISLPAVNGHEKHLLFSFAKLLDKQGRPSGEWLIAADVSDLKLRERQMAEMSHLATLGEMSAGLAHELKQPMNILRLTLANLTRKQSTAGVTPEFLSAKLAQMNDVVDRLDSLLVDIKSFGRVDGDEIVSFDLCKSIQTVEGLLREQVALEDISVNVSLPDSNAQCSGVQLKFEQALINIINNARDAIVESGRPGEIRISVIESDEDWLLHIRDNGPGFPPALIQKVLEPFFSTKGREKGTGLGLSFSNNVIKAMKGSLQLSNWEQGAQVAITLPKATSRA